MRKSHLPWVLIAVVIITSCDRRDGQDTSSTAGETATTPSSAAEPATNDAVIPDKAVAALDDDESLALGLLAAADMHALQAVQQAMVRKLSPDTMEYARNVEGDMIDNLAATQAMGTLANTPEIQAMKAKNTRDLAALDTQSDTNYQGAFLDAMVQDHTETLALIDGRLLPLTTVGPVREYLTKAREEAMRHLQAAKKVQAASAR